MRCLLSALAVVLVLVSNRAKATVVDPIRVEILGFDPSERKVFALTDFGEPALYVADLRRGNGARFVRARSWERRDDFAERLDRLRRRLVPLVAENRGVFNMRATLAPQSGPRAEETRRMADEIALPIERQHAEIELTHGGRTGHLELEVVTNMQEHALFGVRGVWSVPGEAVSIGVVRAFTTPWEGGHADDHLVILR